MIISSSSAFIYRPLPFVTNVMPLIKSATVQIYIVLDPCVQLDSLVGTGTWHQFA